MTILDLLRGSVRFAAPPASAAHTLKQQHRAAGNNVHLASNIFVIGGTAGQAAAHQCI